MAYNKKKIYEGAVDAIKKNNLFFISDIVAFVPCNKDTLYRFFPVDSVKYDTLKGLLNDNKVKTKSAIRKKLFKGDKAAELLALYKIICTDEERMNLATNYNRNENLNTDVTLADLLKN